MQVLVCFLLSLFAFVQGAPSGGVLPLPQVLPGGSLPRLEDHRIVGGVDALPWEFPHQVSMQKQGIFGRSHMCGGSVLSENFVITAGHCVHGQNPSKIFVVAGEFDLKSHSEDEQTSGAIELILHEHYDGATHTNDIGLIRLATPLVLNDMVKPVTLPEQMELVPAGTMCTTTGWGTTSSGGSISNILQKVDVPVIDDDVCRSSYGTTSVDDSMICAGYPEGGKDSCQGDSGGPFICEGKLQGLTSWGRGCARPNYPGVYLEVPYFRDWIDAHAL